jgi:putative endonuclease
MYVVYVLRDADGKLYKGMTADLERRLLGHRQGNTRTTRNMRDIEIVYQETCPDRTSARVREKYLKTAAGRRFLKEILGP